MNSTLAFAAGSHLQTWQVRTELALQHDRVIELHLRSGDVVRCETGTLWLTEPGRQEDTFLRNGESLRVHGERRLVASSFGRALLSVTSDETVARWCVARLNARDLFEKLQAALRGWLHIER